MTGSIGDVLAGIAMVSDMVAAFEDENGCRRLLEALIWPRSRLCPACGYRRSTTLAGCDLGRRARPGLYQCSNGVCRFQFTVTTRTPLHSTKLPLRVWLTGLWLILQSDKGISSVGLSEAIGVSQPTAWRMGHALRLLLTREQPFAGTVEIDEFYIGGSPRRDADRPRLGRGRKGLQAVDYMAFPFPWLRQSPGADPEKSQSILWIDSEAAVPVSFYPLQVAFSRLRFQPGKVQYH